MANHSVDITYLDLAIAGVMILASMLISWRLHLGLGRDMLVGAVRSFLQLALTGYILAFIFERGNLGEWYWTLLALAVMLTVAVKTAQGRIPEWFPHKAWVFAVAIVCGGMAVLFYVTAIVVRIHPWYNPRYVLPLAGMIFGNAMTAGTLAVSRYISDLRGRRLEVETALALGANTTQAVERIRRDALRLAIIPSVNALLVVGIVSLPGMMTGQIIAGASPLLAVRYQVMVVYMITAAAAFTSVISVMAAIRQTFTSAQQLSLYDK